VAVLRPFGPRGTVETLIARSHSMPSRARRSRPPRGILIPHIGLPGTTGWALVIRSSFFATWIGRCLRTVRSLQQFSQWSTCTAASFGVFGFWEMYAIW